MYAKIKTKYRKDFDGALIPIIIADIRARMKKRKMQSLGKSTDIKNSQTDDNELIEPVKKLKNRVLIMNDRYKSTWKLKDFLIQQAMKQTNNTEKQSFKKTHKKSLLDISYREFLIEKLNENRKTKALMTKLPTIHEEGNKCHYVYHNNRQKNCLK